MVHKVAVSVGHYPGETTRDIEYPANVKTAGLLHSLLVTEGFSAELIGGASLQNKVQQVNSFNPEIAIECHFNRLGWPHNPDRYGSGYEVCTWEGSRNGNKLGAAVLEGFAQRLPFRRRGLGIWERRDLYFLKHTRCPALIIEPLFLDNPQEIPFLEMKHGYKFIAEAVFIGITKYFTE